MKKTVMPHNLAKALMEASMHHFDDGGAVPATSTGAASPGQTTTISNGSQAHPTSDPLGKWINSGLTNTVTGALGPIGNTINGIGGAVGGIMGGLASAFTTQNNYQAQLAPEYQSNYSGLINQTANNTLGYVPQYQQSLIDQNNLARQLMLQSQGQGPNPALNQLNQATGQNAANTAALMASARGANANPGQIAKNAAVAGANIQQNAAGQAATLQAQQELAAEQAAGGIYNNIGNSIQGEQGINNQLFGSAVGGQNTQNANTISNYANAQGINSQVAQNNTNAVNKTEGGLLGGVASLGGLLYKGGKVWDAVPAHLKTMKKIYHSQKFDNGGSVAPVNVPNLSNSGALQATPDMFSKSGGGGSGAMGGLSSLMGGGGGGGMASLAMLAAGGGKVPGKDVVPGKNSPKNDTVPAMLSPNEVVLPLSVTQSSDPVRKAAEFMAHLKGEDRGYGKVAKARRSLKDRVAYLEARCHGGMVG